MRADRAHIDIHKTYNTGTDRNDMNALVNAFELLRTRQHLSKNKHVKT